MNTTLLVHSSIWVVENEFDKSIFSNEMFLVPLFKLEFYGNDVKPTFLNVIFLVPLFRIRISWLRCFNIGT